MPFEIDQANKQVKILMDFSGITGCQDCKFAYEDNDECLLLDSWSMQYSREDGTMCREDCPLFPKEVDE